MVCATRFLNSYNTWVALGVWLVSVGHLSGGNMLLIGLSGFSSTGAVVYGAQEDLVEWLTQPKAGCLHTEDPVKPVVAQYR